MDQQRTDNSTHCSDVSKSCWSQAEVQALVTLWANQSVQEQLLLNLRNENVFADLSARLASLGFNKAPKRCREKIKKLKVEYKKIKGSCYRRGTTNDYGGVWFAIMDGVLNYQPGAATHSETMEPSSTEPNLSQSFLDVEAGGKEQSIWLADEVEAFVKLWTDRSVQEQLRSTLRNKDIFIRLSSELASLGFYKAPNRCREKIKKLKQECKRIKSSGGPNQRERRWFAIMDSVLHPPFTGEVSADSKLLDSAQPSNPYEEFYRSEKCPPWSPNDVQDVLGYQPGPLGLEPVNSATVNDSLLVPNYNTGAGKEHISWSPEEVEDLVKLWADNSVQEQLLSTYRNEKIFISLSSQLTFMGYNKTGSQCRTKIKKLKQEYKRIKDTGALSQQHSKWFIIMDDILSSQQEALPPEEADSSQKPLQSTRPSWSVKVEDSEVSHSDEGPSVSSEPSGCEVKTATAPLEPTLQDVPLEDEQSVEASLEPSFISAPTAPSSSCLSVSSPEPTTTCHKDTDHNAWMPGEVQVFLTLWAEPSVQEQLLSPMRNKRVFTHLSNQLASVGFHKTPHQCRIKVKKLKQGYKKNKCMKGSKRIKSRWFAIMDSVLDPGGENETNDSKEVDSPAVLTHPGSPEDEHTTDKLRTVWTPEEVHVLLALWAEGSVQEQLTSTVRNKKVYAQLSSELATLGFDKTPSQCRFKLKKLKQEYKAAKDQKDSKWRKRAWFAIMDKVLGYQGPDAETEEAAEVMDSPVSLETSQHGFPEMAEDLGGCLTFSALSLVVPTLRLMCAFAWQVVQHCNVMHYGKVEELVRLVTEMVPEVLTPREKVQLLLRLRSRLVLELCRSESTANPLVIEPHLKVIHNLPNGSNYDQEDAEELENSKSNFVEIVQTLLKDPEERKTFFKEVFPVHYGQQYEATLYTLVWKFISRLDELLPVPDVKQTAEWLSTAPSVMEECGQLVLEPDQLKTLLHCHHRHPRNTTKCYSPDTHDGISSTLPLKAKLRRFTSEQISSSSSKGTRYLTEPISDRYNKNEGQSDHSREEEEEEPTEENQSDDEWTPEDCGKRSQVLELKDKPRKGPSPVKHSDFHRIAPLRMHTCSLCPYSHSQVAGLLQHIRKEHLVKQPSHAASDTPETDSVPAQAETEMRTDTIRSRIHACNRCAMVFKTLSALTRHIATHTLPFCCDHCKKRYARKALLDKHQRVHTGERPYPCSHCSRAFMRQATLKAHVRTHTGERPYQCHICGKTSIQHLARHILMHKGEKNYLCTDCGKAFLSSGELKLHMRHHTGERPYTCKQCGKGYIAKCHLTIHMRSHTGERPYSCTECPKSFPTSNLRKRHMFIHYDKKPFQCFKCGKGFTQAHTMKMHIRTRRCK